MKPANILILNPDPRVADALSGICRRAEVGPGAVSIAVAVRPDDAFRTPDSRDVHVLLADRALASPAFLRAYIGTDTSLVITGDDETGLAAVQASWPGDFYVDVCRFSPSAPAEETVGRAVERASAHARLRRQIRDMKAAAAAREAKVREVYTELQEVKGLLNSGFLREMEKRIAIEARYAWFQKERFKVEGILRKIYAANDVSSLLDVVPDIKDVVRAGGASLYVLDKSEAAGRFLKPLVWEDAFLGHADGAQHLIPLAAPDFAAEAVRRGEEIGLADAGADERLTLRYREQMKQPLRSLLAVPLRYEAEVIGVFEVYNKTGLPADSRDGFSAQDRQILKSLAEHIAIAMTKLNLIQYDALTGLLRPDPFFEKVLQKINSQSKRRQEEGSSALVMGDVDWFKHYNDRNGHEAGNRLLHDLAGILKLSIRDEDLLCRYGGEEFLFFLTGVKGLEEAGQLTERIRRNVENHYFEAEEFQPQNNVTMSFGVTLFPTRQNGETDPALRNDLIKLAAEADAAMAEAKGKKSRLMPGPGREDQVVVKNKVCCYSREWPDENRRTGILAFNERYFREKRKFARFLASAAAMIREDGGYRVAKTVNLSLGGAKIVTPWRLSPARAVDLLLVLGDRANPFRSDVVYSDKANGGSPYFYTGLRFKPLTFEERKSLEDYFKLLQRKDRSNG
jgi:diguanylate cyclase (GGDEF)-like protein